MGAASVEDFTEASGFFRVPSKGFFQKLSICLMMDWSFDGDFSGRNDFAVTFVGLPLASSVDRFADLSDSGAGGAFTKFEAEYL